jgi:hypothetical protein
MAEFVLLDDLLRHAGQVLSRESCRVADARDRDSGGAGLGFAIERVAQVHGGSIHAENRGGLEVGRARLAHVVRGETIGGDCRFLRARSWVTPAAARSARISTFT